MTAYKWFFPVLALAVTVMWVGTIQSEETNGADRRMIYTTMLDRYAASCENQSNLRHSRSRNLREKAELSCLKTAYIKSYKNKIINQLMEKDIKPRTYKVRYFVNTLFYDLIRRETSVVLNNGISSGYLVAEKIGTK